MKKSLLFVSVMAFATTFTSCLKDGSFENKITINAPAISIITSIDNNELAAVIPGIYEFNIKVSDSSHSATILSPNSSNNFIVDNTSLEFSTEPKEFTTSGYDYFVQNVEGTVGTTGLELNNASFLAANPMEESLTYGYYFNSEDIGEYTFKLSNNLAYITIAKYNMGDRYRVVTFPGTTFYKGETTTRYNYNGEPKEFTFDGITYRFSIYNDSKTQDLKAYMILYNARFAEEMPISIAAILVEGLDVEFSPSGVKITGEGITPTYYRNGEYLELPQYEFKSLEFETTSSDLIYGKVSYQVGDDYFGSFEGSYGNFYKVP